MKKLNNKGQIFENMGAMIIGVGTLALILVIVFLINQGVREQTVNDITTTTYGNASFTFVNGTQTRIGNCVGSISCTALMNGSVDYTEIASGNYTCSGTDYETGINPTIIGFDNPSTTLLLNYSCKDASVAYNSTSTLNNDTYSLVGWVGLIIIILIGILILGLVRMIRQ